MANELDDGTVGAMFRNFQPRVPEQPIYSMAAYVNKHVVVQSAANLTKDQALQYAQSMVNFFKTAEGAGPGHGAAVKVADGSNVLLLPGMHVSVIAMGQSPSTGKLNINWEKIFAWEDVLWSSTTKSSGGQMAPMLHGAEIGAALKAAGPKTDLVVYLNTTPSKKTHYRVVINRRFSVWEGDVQAGQNIAVLADPLPPSGYQSNAATGEGVWGQPKQKLQHPKWLRVVIDSVDQKLDNSVKLLPGMEVQVFAEALENQHQPMSPYAKGGQITPRLPPQLHGVDWSRAKGIIAGVDELEVHVEQEDGTLGAVKMGYRAQQPRVPQPSVPMQPTAPMPGGPHEAEHTYRILTCALSKFNSRYGDKVKVFGTPQPGNQTGPACKQAHFAFKATLTQAQQKLAAMLPPMKIADEYIYYALERLDNGKWIMVATNPIDYIAQYMLPESIT